MLPATHPYEARYKHEHTGSDGKTRWSWTSKPVIAWDDDGRPLVAGDRQLVRADCWTNYGGIVEADAPIVAVVPGGGWRVEHKPSNGQAWSQPLVAWAVRSDGSAFPLDTDGDGPADELTTTGGEWRIYHPEQREGDSDGQA